MRIIAGKLKNRKLLDSSNLKDLRPTTDKNRQALFNILLFSKFSQEMNFNFDNLLVLDICSGTGSIAFEALSRGASNAMLVDKNSQHLEIARKNSAILGVENNVEFLLCDAENLPVSNIHYGFVYIDPPYSLMCDKIIQNIIDKNFISKNSLIVVESLNAKDFAGLDMIDSRRYGLTNFAFYKML